MKQVVLLWHGPEPVGVCVFASPAASLTLRSQYFGLTNPRNTAGLAGLNAQLWVLARIVLHPAYRGGGIAQLFVRKACSLCPVPWIETLSAMGHANPFFERAGFVRVGIIRKADSSTASGAYGGRQRKTDPSAAKSRYSEPVYYVYDNRKTSG